jgi:hypothetical protein
MERRVRRDVRRFVYHRFRLLECPRRVPLNLTAVWRDRHGYVPAFMHGTVAGSHFLLPGGCRGVVFSRPNRMQVPDAVRRQLFTLIAIKHAVEDVRLATGKEVPDLRAPDRLPTEADLELVEEWPVAAEHHDLLVAEYVSSSGSFVTERVDPWHATGDLDEALMFLTPDEAYARLALERPAPPVTLRYLAAARAEADQRAAAVIDEARGGSTSETT